MDSDDDSLPLITRVAAAGEGAQGAAPKPQHKAESASDDDDDLPAWAKDYKVGIRGAPVYPERARAGRDRQIKHLNAPSSTHAAEPIQGRVQGTSATRQRR